MVQVQTHVVCLLYHVPQHQLRPAQRMVRVSEYGQRMVIRCNSEVKVRENDYQSIRVKYDRGSKKGQIKFKVT